MNQDDIEENSVEYWKLKYEDLNIQYDEYQKQSAELENELEIQLKQTEERIRDLENKNNRLNIDNETLKNKLNEVHTTTHKQILQLQEELAKSNAVKDEMHKYIRELEQKNDNLEQNYRCTLYSLADFEAKMNEALERNAILESELDEKDALAETVQRLRDEARDLQQELAVRQKKEFVFTSPSKITLNGINELENHHQQHEHAVPNDVTMSDANDVLPNAQFKQTLLSLKPAARITALNYVGDILRKLTTMESKLLTSKSLIKEPNRDRRSLGLSANDKPTRKMFKREENP